MVPGDAPVPPAAGVARLATEVLRSALVDFGVLHVDVRRGNGPRRRDIAEEAGRFLLQRTDTAARFWFTAAGVELERFRADVWRHRPEWYERLRALQRREGRAAGR